MINPKDEESTTSSEIAEGVWGGKKDDDDDNDDVVVVVDVDDDNDDVVVEKEEKVKDDWFVFVVVDSVAFSDSVPIPTHWLFSSQWNPFPQSACSPLTKQTERAVTPPSAAPAWHFADCRHRWSPHSATAVRSPVHTVNSSACPHTPDSEHDTGTRSIHFSQTAPFQPARRVWQSTLYVHRATVHVKESGSREKQVYGSRHGAFVGLGHNDTLLKQQPTGHDAKLCCSVSRGMQCYEHDNTYQLFFAVDAVDDMFLCANWRMQSCTLEKPFGTEPTKLFP